MHGLYEKLTESRDYIRSRTQIQPKAGIVLGSGLSALVDELNVDCEIFFDDIPHFASSRDNFHPGKMVFGRLDNVPVVIMSGRYHYYEGFSMEEVAYPVRVLKWLDCESLLLTNASGGLRENQEKGDLLMVTDHISLMPDNPLRGKNDDRIGDRFPDMFATYDPKLQALLEKAAEETHISLKKGIYLGLAGPNLETPAEYNYLRIIGADCVGMSTIPEVLAARHMRFPLAVISVITDLCYPGKLAPVSLPEIIKAANEAEPKIRRLCKAFVNKLPA